MRKKYDDDDGRVIADMSDFQRRPLIVPNLGGKKQNIPAAADEDEVDLISDPGEKTRKKSKAKYKESMNREERHAAISGAVAAGLIVAGVLIAGLAVIIIIFSSFGK